MIKKQLNLVPLLLILSVLIGAAFLIDYRFDKSMESMNKINKEVSSLNKRIKVLEKNIQNYSIELHNTMYLLIKMQKKMDFLYEQDSEIDGRLIDIENYLSRNRRYFY